MISNFWQRIHFFCIHDAHNEPVPFSVMEGSSSFYACPRYMRKDAAHPDGHEEGERACANRISFRDTEKIVEFFGSMYSEDLANGILMDYTGVEFDLRSYHVKVLRYSMNGDIDLGVINKAAVGRRA